MIHIVFQGPDEEVLAKSFELDETLRGEIIQIKDDFAVGPLFDIYTEEGIEARKQWWRSVLEGSEYEGKVDRGEVNDPKIVEEILGKLSSNKEETVWIWAAQNQHDMCGYYWLISLLKYFKGRIFIVYLHNLPFINEKGHIFYPTKISEIQPKEFLKAKKLARPVTNSEFEADPDEWTKLCNENKGVRILEGGKKLLQYGYDYYDDELMKHITADWQKVNKLLHAFFPKAKTTTGDAYLLWRLKLMISDQKIDAQGNMKYAKDFEVKLKVTN
jgi:hypothetical protein